MTSADTFAGRNWHYEFRALSDEFTESACAKVANRLLERYSVLTKSWTLDMNSEWTCRLFMSAKLVMAATLHVNSEEFANSRNLRVVVPYLRYYAVLSLLRAVCYTLPEHNWENGRLIQISHKAAIEGASEHLRRFDSRIANIANAEIRALKAEREFISYRAPSSGDDRIQERNRFLWLCSLLAEVAQFNSELLESSLCKHVDKSGLELLPEYLEQITGVEIDGHYFGDNEDAYRLSYLVRKHPFPANLRLLMREGHVDDFFGAWHSGTDDQELFDPDQRKSIIFDIP